MKCDVLIVGAGLVGASLAAALGPSGLQVILLDADAQDEPSRDGWDTRMYALSPGSRRFLSACGAWQRLPPDRVAAVEAMQVFGDGGLAELSFSAYECGLAELCCIVEGRELQRALTSTVVEFESLRSVYGCSPVGLSVDEANMVVELADGESIVARLLVGADGAQSWVRENAGIEPVGRAYGQQGVVANFEIELGHDAIARQWFRADGILALLPLPANRVSLVWSTSDALAARLLTMSPRDFEREVETASGRVLGEMRLLTAPRSYPLHLMRAREFVRPRLALVGDAAHVLHPLAGQGLNLGLQDAAKLAQVLRERGVQDDCGDYRLLRRYARARDEAVASMQWTTDALQRLFSSRAPGVRWLRNNGLKLTNRISPLKQALIEHALG